MPLQGAEEELPSENQTQPGLLQAVLDAAPTVVIVLDTFGRIVHFNHACVSVTGFDSEEVIGRHVVDVLVPYGIRDEVRDVFERLVHGEFPLEHENDWLTQDGELRRIRFHNTVLRDDHGRVTHVVATGVDITAERKAESRAQAAYSQLSRLLDSCPALVGELDRDYRFVFANGEYRRWFGIAPSTISGQHASRIIGHAAFERLRPCYDRALSGQVAVYDGEVPYALGGLRNIHGVYVPRTDESGNVIGCYVMAVDLTEQTRLAVALDASARRSSAILDAADDAIITLSEDCRIESFNRAAESMFQYRAAEVTGFSIDTLVPGFLWSPAKSGQEAVAQCRDGSRFPVEISLGTFEQQGCRHYAVFIRDVTQRKRVEAEARSRLDQLAHMTRVAAMGDLAAGIAHEVNQPLTAVATMADACLRLVKTQPARQDRITYALEQMSRQARRASDVIQEMRSFLRKGDNLSTSQEDFGRLLVRTLELVRHDLDRMGVQLVLDLQQQLPSVNVNTIQVEQVIFNLLRNAIDAMASSRRRELHLHAAERDDMLQVHVCDSGTGVPAEIRGSLFQPFTTSRPSGLGQGLCISRSIARAHGGDLTLESTGDNGSCFSLRIPFDRGANE